MVQNNVKQEHCGCQQSAVGCTLEDKKTKSKNKNNSEKMHFELSPLIAWIAFWIVNTNFEFQENIFSTSRDITKCLSFCTTTPMMPRL